MKEPGMEEIFLDVLQEKVFLFSVPVCHNLFMSTY